ncbi:DUF4317 domain-containing protein [Salisediminibacterium halotolerans]|uniref:DUF4317 domain-containing protein n=1 Tax=Salisediminibacterium halotolerans TaxID=517425 RepID=UPI000EB32609|nr:DUF4317 domain-containing protein [Salisediminibacterium halotolerans]RLJ71692.1 uncharacterized protein DUF4317 [Actinophytocola xinjiangensis]RPE86842.1 uncharacterized protein DUF4317 [Salisediminibacterium halotolerans]TWG32905.1 uncharacterized protein DUF4317 [Salisediminibacterium halotolerans]GEL07759.1 hypothetical protein SHA02_11750 [Salisediminibacterium halotolerans]
MNKKDIAHMRNQFKLDNDLLTVTDISNAYVMKETDEIYHQQTMPFELLEDEQKEMFMTNFKKVLTGQLDEKLFELAFQKDADDSSQLTLHQGLLSDASADWTAQMEKIVQKMLANKTYDFDIVITFIRGEYNRPVKKGGGMTEESDRDAVYANPFILCSINKTLDPKKELLFDYVEKEFKYNIVVDPIINLQAPIAGFLFPVFHEGTADVNRILYAAAKANEPDTDFIADVLTAEEVMTAQEDKAVFEEIVKEAAGEKINTETLANVYEEIHRAVEEHEEDEPRTLDSRDVENVLQSSGVKEVDSEKVRDAFKTVIDDEQYELKAENVVPKYTSKSIKIKTKVADIAISPQDLKYVKQIEMNGKLHLMLEVPENTVIEGFEMIPEALAQKAEDKEE